VSTPPLLLLLLLLRLCIVVCVAGWPGIALQRPTKFDVCNLDAC